MRLEIWDTTPLYIFLPWTELNSYLDTDDKIRLVSMIADTYHRLPCSCLYKLDIEHIASCLFRYGNSCVNAFETYIELYLCCTDIVTSYLS